MVLKKNLKGKVTIQFNYWEVGGEEVEPEHEKELIEKANIHVKDNIIKGFTNGELPTVSKASFNKMYSGFWSVTKKIN